MAGIESTAKTRSVLSIADAGHDKEGAEEVDDPVEAVDEDPGEEDEDGTHDEGADDAPEEDAVLDTVRTCDCAGRLTIRRRRRSPPTERTGRAAQVALRLRRARRQQGRQ